ncbi:high mobility group B protein 7 isoform X2 [Ananas comosus]|uniref:High mobility group B protein 7 isoform X2 n=1 Tax=Ananas comosus TaxID=4615 RepID=A0A6P5GRV5_ANACO|nr:high mobility group B protein 7 isoform X2 [Ananas comosus]
MANGSRGRKRVHAPRRAPDGSAFIKCERCDRVVAIALLDMHECESNAGFGLKGRRGGKEALMVGAQDQPRSPFCCFMESFRKKFGSENWIEVDRRGFETWKNMTPKERRPFAIEAEEINKAYEKMLLEEVGHMSEADDEADSPKVGVGEKIIWFCEISFESSDVEWDQLQNFASFDSDEWDY